MRRAEMKGDNGNRDDYETTGDTRDEIGNQKEKKNLPTDEDGV